MSRPKEGLQWQNGAVGNAEWTGVLLRDILAAAGLKGAAQEVLLVGADSGVVDCEQENGFARPDRIRAQPAACKRRSPTAPCLPMR